MGKYVGSSEYYFDQSHCYANFVGLFLPAGSKITKMNHRDKNARLKTQIGRENIEMVGIAGERYYGGADDIG